MSILLVLNLRIRPNSLLIYCLYTSFLAVKLHHLFEIPKVNVSHSPSLAMCMSSMKVQTITLLCETRYIFFSRRSSYNADRVTQFSRKHDDIRKILFYLLNKIRPSNMSSRLPVLNVERRENDISRCT